MGDPALYHELARYYDRIYHRKDYAAEARELGRRARRISPSARTLLDVACGTGRHLETFRRQFEVEGVDASRDMLRIARGRLGRNIPLARGDMRTFRRPREFDVLVCLFSAIGYMARRADRRAAFRNFYRHLSPGGVALIEGWLLPSAFRPGTPHLQVYDGSDAKIVRVSYSARRGADSRIDMHYLIGEPGRGVRHLREVHRQPLIEPSQMLGDLRAAGFVARVSLTGRYRSRGLYIGRKPAARARPYARDKYRRPPRRRGERGGR